MGGGLSAAVVGTLAWVVLASPLLAVRQVDVVAQHQFDRLTRGRVVRAAHVSQGVPLARVGVDSVRRRVAQLRLVRSVRVRRVWPSTVRIVVREREAVAAVPHGDGYLLLDREGVRVAGVSKAPENLPVVKVMEPGRRAGPRNSPRPGTTGAALRVLDGIPDELAGKVTAATVTGDRRVTLRLHGGATVVWGRPGNAAEKADALLALMRDSDTDSSGETAAYDVSSPEVVTVR